MHAFYLHIGDYLRDAGHLSMLGSGAYFSLLRVYYSTESAIPAESKQSHKLARCTTPQERKAVDEVLKEFFTLQSDGWHHKRCDIEITKFRVKSAKARESAEARWNAENNAKAMRTHSERNAKAMQAVSRKPLSTSTTLSGKPDDAREVIDYLNAVCKSKFKPVPANLNLITALFKQGATPQDCKAVIDLKHLEWANDPERKKYLRPETLFNATKFAQYDGASAPAALGYDPKVLASLRDKYGDDVRIAKESERATFYQPGMQRRFDADGTRLMDM